MISSAALGEDGREVRCGKCGHMWFQAPERDSLDDLPPVPVEDAPSSPSQGFDIGFEPHVDQPEPVKPPEPKPEKVAKAKPSKPPREPRANKGIFAKIEKVVPLEKQRHIAGVMVALAVVSVSFYTLVANRDTWGRSVSFLGAAYDKMGFPLTPMKPQIAFDRLRLSKTGNKVVATGHVLNLTDREVSIDHITVDLTDFDYKVLKTVDIKMGKKSLAPETSEKIEFFFEDVPKDAVSVRVRLVQ